MMYAKIDAGNIMGMSPAVARHEAWVKRNINAIAAINMLLHDYCAQLKQSISDSKPRKRQDLWKKISRSLRERLDKHTKNWQYNLTDEDRKRAVHNLAILQEEVGSNLFLLYFTIRNEVINHENIDESEVGPACYARIIEVILHSLYIFNVNHGGSCLNQELSEIYDIVKSVDNFEDKQKHQELVEKILTRSMEVLVNE